MPALVIALGVVAIWIFTKSNGQNVAVVQTTPFNGGTGITTGFAPPSVETGSSSLVKSPGQKNQPSSSGSGVPDFSSQTQEFNTGPLTAIPSPGFSAFYHPTQAGLLKPIASMASRPSGPEKAAGSCGCGGGCSKGPSDCGNQKRRINDSGCLAPSRARQIKNTPPQIFYSWADNIAGSGYDMTDALDHTRYRNQLESPPNGYENFIPPAPEGVTSIGMPPNGF